MPLTPATLSRSKKLSPAPAASLPTQPASLLLHRPASPASEIGDRRFPHSPALPLFVLVKRRQALDAASGSVQSRCRGAQEPFPPFVLVKRVGAASVLLTSVFTKLFFPIRVSETLAPAQRVRGHWWALRQAGTLGRMCWARIAGQFSGARQIVLVKSFSSACNAPLPTLCDPGAGSDLNGRGASHA